MLLQVWESAWKSLQKHMKQRQQNNKQLKHQIHSALSIVSFTELVFMTRLSFACIQGHQTISVVLTLDCCREMVKGKLMISYCSFLFLHQDWLKCIFVKVSWWLLPPVVVNLTVNEAVLWKYQQWAAYEVKASSYSIVRTLYLLKDLQV